MIVTVAVVAYGAFTDLNNPKLFGKTKDKQRAVVVDANFALLESGVGAGATALSVTNGQPVTVAAGVYVISGINGALNSTNTITLVAPTAAGQKVTFLGAADLTNAIAIADSGTVAAAGAIAIQANDTAVLQANGTATWCEVSNSDN